MARILFVDDDPITLKLLCRIAEMNGHEALSTQSGQEALAMVMESEPGLIVLDMMMKEMDGLAVLAKLRAMTESAHIPVVMLSAGFELDAAERVTAAGAQAYLTKPISIDALQEVITKYVQ